MSKISQNLPLETNRCCTQYYIFTNWKIQRNVYPQSLVRFSIFRKVFRWELSLKVFHKVWFSVLNITQSFSAENCLYIAKIRKLSLKVFHKVQISRKVFRLRIVFIFQKSENCLWRFPQSLVSVFLNFFGWELSLKVFHKVWFKFSIITQDFSFTNFINFLAKK